MINQENRMTKGRVLWKSTSSTEITGVVAIYSLTLPPTAEVGAKPC